MKSKEEKLREAKEELKLINEQINNLKIRKHQIENEIETLKIELETMNVVKEISYQEENFSWSEKIYEILRNIFKINEFRSLQKVCINATLNNSDCLLIMPTGGGKSLCFQLPALISIGITIVISPLISLMEDQLFALKQLQISAVIFNAQTTREESTRMFNEMILKNSKLKIIYITPEKLAKSKRFMSQLEKVYSQKRFSRLVIDEVHCCSQWGHDFRPDYKFLGIMKTQFPDTPILGLTATATSAVIVDIQKMLNIEGNCIVLKDSFYRPNLHYSIEETASKDADDIVKLIKTRFASKCGIIYCLTIKDTEEVSKQLCSARIKSSAYHAQMSAEDRTEIHKMWQANEIHVIVATIAFGMGINKLDVRFVIHYSMSKSIENYYQETGRAGRDGTDAYCIMFYRYSDVTRLTSLFFTERSALNNIYKMIAYTVNYSKCRKKFLAEYFEDENSTVCNGMCDNCNRDLENGLFMLNVKPYVEDILNILKNASKLKERMTSLKLLDAWTSKGNKKLRVDNILPKWFTRSLCEHVIIRLLIDGYLKEEFHFTPYSTISYLISGHKAALLNKVNELNYQFLSSCKVEKSPNKRSLEQSSQKTSSSSSSSSFRKEKKAKFVPVFKKLKTSSTVEEITLE